MCAAVVYVYPNASMYVEDVVTGAYRWNITSTPISLDRTYETGPSSIDVHYAYCSSGWHAWDNAWTEMVRQDYGEIDPDEEDWDYARIFINRYRSIPDTERTCVIVCHEMGHAFGLAHTNSQPENIMCQEASGRTTHNPSADDAAGINYLYD